MFPVDLDTFILPEYFHIEHGETYAVKRNRLREFIFIVADMSNLSVKYYVVFYVVNDKRQIVANYSGREQLYQNNLMYHCYNK